MDKTLVEAVFIVCVSFGCSSAITGAMLKYGSGVEDSIRRMEHLFFVISAIVFITVAKICHVILVKV